MKKNLNLVASAFIAFAASAFATDYSTWSGYKNIRVSTTAAGITTAGTVASKFPLLVRLTSANADVFTAAASDGSDIRFTAADGTTDIPYEIERWNKVGQTGAIWVSVPTVVGNSDTGASLRMYWGKSAQTTTSNSAAVFDTASGFLVAMHLNEATGDTARDATANRYKGVPVSNAATPPVDTSSSAVGTYISGNFKRFWGGSSVGSGGSYRLIGADGSGTASGKLSFLSSANTYTLSAWVYPNMVPVANTDRSGIIAKSTGATYSNYHIRVLETQPGNVQFSDGNGSTGSPSASVGSALVTGAWQHIVVVRSGPPTAAANSMIFLNGTGYNGTNGANVSTANTNDVYVGSFSNLTGFFSGEMDEVEISGTARSGDWNVLSYQTQKPGSTALILGVSQSAPVIATHPQNLTTTVGSQALFTVVASGATPFTYKWVKNNIDTISGATSDTLKLNSVAAGDTGSYKVIVKNSLGTAVSNSATLTLVAGPSITSHPANFTALSGGTAKFGITTSAAPPYTYKWVKNGTDTVRTTTNSSSITDTLALTNVPKSDNNATYKCLLINGTGQSISLAAALTVYGLPVITLQPANQTVFVGASAKFIVGDTGATLPLTYKWVKGGTDTVRNVSSSLGADTLVFSSVTSLDSNTSYKCVIRNVAGQVISNTALLIANPVAILPGVGTGSLEIQTSGSEVFFRIPAGTNVTRLSILDVAGHLVWSKENGAGIREVSWKPKSKGIYVIRYATLDANSKFATVSESKIILAP